MTGWQEDIIARMFADENDRPHHMATEWNWKRSALTGNDYKFIPKEEHPHE